MTAPDRSGAPPLGPLLVLTDRTQCRRPLLEVLAGAVDGGARTVVLRDKDLPSAERADLTEAVRALLAPVGGTLVLAGTGVPADAVHLSSTDRVPSPRPRLLGRSCHDLTAVRRAASEGCDWVTVSPVRLTASKPGYGPALGLAGLRRLTGEPVPVYALGGLSARDGRPCREAGAAGVALMGAVMRAEDPARIVADLLASLTPEAATPQPPTPHAPTPEAVP